MIVRRRRRKILNLLENEIEIGSVTNDNEFICNPEISSQDKREIINQLLDAYLSHTEPKEIKDEICITETGLILLAELEMLNSKGQLRLI